ncbi:hypothetical protein BX070DRAFT_219240 [Coemansia spiralis]|nr:hypothetical protein BX070DRAFT_219240 [Coemansia spiralis]
MRFRTLTGIQRHRLTNVLFVAGVASAIGTVTGSSLLGCPAVNRDSRLDGEDIDQKGAKDTPVLASDQLKGLEEKRFVGGKMISIVQSRS